MSNETNDSSFFSTLMWSLAGLVLLYVGLFVVLLVDAEVFDSALWMAIPDPFDDKLDDMIRFVYWPILRFFGWV